MSNKLFFVSLISILILKLCLSVALRENVDGDIETTQYSFLYSYIDIVLLTLLIIQIIKKHLINRLQLPLLLMFSMIIVRTLVDFSYDISISLSIISQIKILLPILMLLVLINTSIPVRKARQSLLIITATVVLLSLYAFIFFPNSSNRGEYFWPVYFSGLHTQAYVILATYIFLYFHLIQKKGFKWVLFSYIIIFLILFWGYNVRTTVVSLLAFSLALFLQYQRKIGQKNSFTALFFLFTIIAVLSVLLNSSINFDTFSSGRLSMYYLKYQELLGRDILSILFGTGSSSDLVKSNIWWWAEKGAHNDYITILIEGGLANVLLLVVLYISLLRSLRNPKSHAVFIAYFTSSLISNGFIARPMPTYILMLAVYYLEIDYTSRRKKLQRRFITSKISERQEQQYV